MCRMWRNGLRLYKGGKGAKAHGSEQTPSGRLVPQVPIRSKVRRSLTLASGSFCQSAHPKYVNNYVLAKTALKLKITTDCDVACCFLLSYETSPVCQGRQSLGSEGVATPRFWAGE